MPKVSCGGETRVGPETHGSVAEDFVDLLVTLHRYENRFCGRDAPTANEIQKTMSARARRKLPSFVCEGRAGSQWQMAVQTVPARKAIIQSDLCLFQLFGLRESRAIRRAAGRWNFKVRSRRVDADLGLTRHVPGCLVVSGPKLRAKERRRHTRAPPLSWTASSSWTTSTGFMQIWEGAR
jgi:hypothetical protein